MRTVCRAEVINGEITADELLVACTHRRKLQYRVASLCAYSANLDEVTRQFHIGAGAAACVRQYRIDPGCRRIVLHPQHHGPAFCQVQEEVPVSQRHMGGSTGNNVMPVDRTRAIDGNGCIAINVDISIQ